MRCGIVLAAVAALACLAHASQVPFVLSHDAAVRPEARLTGRFLHITDLHVDENYLEDAAVVSTCHSPHPRQKHGGFWRSGHWGTGVSDCDAPLRLANSTLKWIADNWDAPPALGGGGDVHRMFDFIVWTGDSARHDQDTDIPRTPEEIMRENTYLLHLLETYFPGVPLIPTIGNNDVYVHNTLEPGYARMCALYSRQPKQRDARARAPMAFTRPRRVREVDGAWRLLCKGAHPWEARHHQHQHHVLLRL